MAKGARSSVRKNNNSKLKARVFGPVENARTQRLSAKLLELASQPKPSSAGEMEVEQEEPKDKTDVSEAKKSAGADGGMEVDGAKPQVKSSGLRADKRRKEERKVEIDKKRHRKATNSIHFKGKGVSKRKPGRK